MRKPALMSVALIIALTSMLIAPTSSFAATNTDKLAVAQGKVSYTVYEPIPMSSFAMNGMGLVPCRLFPQKSPMIVSSYGGSESGIGLKQSPGDKDCTGGDTAPVLEKIKIHGVLATVKIYCQTRCSASRFPFVGGEIDMVLPATAHFGSTYIVVGSQAVVTLPQLIAFAQGLVPALGKH